MGKQIKINSEYFCKIDITPASGTPTFVPLAKGIDNISQAMNEVLTQTSFLGDAGYGSTFVTGGQITVSLSGERFVGDDAQDYIFSNDVMYNWGSARETTFILGTPGGAVVKCPCTIANITPANGAPNAAAAISFEIHFNGKPAIMSSNLISLDVLNASIDYVFDPYIYTYDVAIAGTTTTVTATAFAESTIKINNTAAVSGVAKEITLGNIGSRTVVTIEVTNTDVVKTYTLNIFHVPSGS